MKDEPKTAELETKNEPQKAELEAKDTLAPVVSEEGES